MSNTPRQKTAAQQAWRRLRDRDIAAALSAAKHMPACGINLKPGERRTGSVTATSTTSDSAQDTERKQDTLAEG